MRHDYWEKKCSLGGHEYLIADTNPHLANGFVSEHFLRCPENLRGWPRAGAQKGGGGFEETCPWQTGNPPETPLESTQIFESRVFQGFLRHVLCLYFMEAVPWKDACKSLDWQTFQGIFKGFPGCQGRVSSNPLPLVPPPFAILRRGGKRVQAMKVHAAPCSKQRELLRRPLFPLIFIRGRAPSSQKHACFLEGAAWIFHGTSPSLSFLSLFFGQKTRKTTKKQGSLIIPSEPLKFLEKKGKRSKKQGLSRREKIKEFLAREKIKEFLAGEKSRNFKKTRKGGTGLGPRLRRLPLSTPLN